MTSGRALDWDDLRLLAAVAEAGTLTAAAHRLGVDQTTAARRLARLETAVGVGLFDRRDRRLVARPPVEAVVADLAAMVGLADRVAARLRDERLRLTGSVSISVVDLLATDVLAPAVGRFQAAHPGIRLEIAASDRNVSLGAREADVAVRLARPTEDKALARRIARIDFGFWGPAGDDGSGDRPLAGYGDRLAHLPERRWLDARRGETPIAFAADRVAALREAVAAGHRAVLPVFVAAADPRLARLLDAEPVASRDVWLLVHPERRHDRAVAAALDWIETTLVARLRTVPPPATADAAGIGG